MIKTIILVLLLALYAGASLAAIRTITGVEEDIWTVLSVVYADISSVANAGPAKVDFTLQVRATLSGSYDAAAKPVLQAELRYGFLTSAIPQPPAAKTRVVVVLRRFPDGRYSVPSDFMTFMPNRAAIVTVAGFDDPKVAETISRLRELRSGKAEKAPGAAGDMKPK